MSKEPKYKIGDVLKISYNTIFLITDIFYRREGNFRYKVSAMNSIHHVGRYVVPISSLDRRKDIFSPTDKEKAMFLLKLENTKNEQ